MTTKVLLIIALISLVMACVMLLPVGGRNLASVPSSGARARPVDLSAFPDTGPGGSLNLLFIHHSVGGHWLADPGPEDGEDCVYRTHPEGGGLRRALEAQGYTVNEASYHSRVGQDTDIVHWLPKFRDQMDQVLTCRRQDEVLPEGRRNQVVMFKSCYPNNAFVGPGTPPGKADDPERTVANARAAYAELRGCFARHPEVLFVCVTAPPQAPGRKSSDRLWKVVARGVLNRPDRREGLLRGARLAREFNNWLTAEDGWLQGYPHRNVVVFDYYDLLTGEGKSDLSRYPTEDGEDSHPSREGQELATARFVPFLNRAVHRAGLVKQ
jgi:hypothetical protein